MAGLQLSEEEQSERLKAWWKENGTAVIAGVVVGIAVIGGVNYWRSYQAEQAETASALYMELLNGAEAGAEGPGRRLIDDYAGTPYAGKAALLMAKSEVEAGGYEAARGHLQWVQDNAADPADRRLATLRLARLALHLGEPEAARTLLADMQPGGYRSTYHELRGDLDMARGDPQSARVAYETALESLPDVSGFADMLNLKLDAAIGASK